MYEIYRFLYNSRLWLSRTLSEPYNFRRDELTRLKSYSLWSTLCDYCAENSSTEDPIHWYIFTLSTVALSYQIQLRKENNKTFPVRANKHKHLKRNIHDRRNIIMTATSENTSELLRFVRIEICVRISQKVTKNLIYHIIRKATEEKYSFCFQSKLIFIWTVKWNKVSVSVNKAFVIIKVDLFS